MNGHVIARHALKTAEIITTILEGLSGPFPVLQPVIGPLQKIVDFAGQYLDNDEDLATLQKYITGIEKDLQRLKRYRKTPSQDQSFTDLKSTLQRISDGIDEMNDPNVVMKVLRTSEIAEKIKEYLSDAEKALDRYHGCLIQEIREIVQDTREDQLLDQLRANTTQDAAWRPELPGCLQGTRTGILEELKQWASNQSTSQVYWLNGYAGTGKTAIAQSFAKSLSSPGSAPVASFFFSQESVDKNDFKRILPTLSYQLSLASPEFKEKLLQSLENKRNISIFDSPTFQLEHLIVNPAKQSELLTVIIIDGLDECEDKDQMRDFLTLLLSRLHEIPKVKLFIASHRDEDVEKSLDPTNLSTLGSSGTDKKLETVNDTEDDIRLFIKTNLRLTSSHRPGITIPKDWPPSDQVNTLIENAAGLFIFASTAVKAVNDRVHDPIERLKRLTDVLNHNGPDRGNDSVAEHDDFYEKLDKLFLSILSISFPSKKTSNLRSILGVLAVACEPLPRSAIGEILAFTDNTIISVLKCLHPFLRIPDDEQAPLVFYHKSFLDFLIDPQRCTEKRFQIDLDASHLKVARSCLALMHSEYSKKAKNVCDLPRYSHNSKLFIDELGSRIGLVTKYGCRYWADHLVAINDLGRKLNDKADLRKSLLSFLQQEQLWWLEVLGLLQDLPRATKALSNVHERLSPLDQGATVKHKDLIGWIDEDRNFLAFAFDAIQYSVAHIYHSALPFLPSDSMYYRQTADTLTRSTEPRVVIGADKSWTDVLNSTASASHIIFAHFSLDGNHIISRSKGETTRVWDATNGTSSEIRGGDSSKFCDGTFLSNNNYVVLYTDDGILALWDRTRPGLCDKNTAGCAEHGPVHRIFPSTHSPLGFFTSHISDNAEQKWSLSYWDVVQDVGESVGDSKHSGSAHLRLLAHGAISLSRGRGVAHSIRHETSPDDAQSTTITVEVQNGQWKFVASMKDPSTTILDPSTTTQVLTFNELEKETPPSKSATDPRPYDNLERPCQLSDDSAWVLDEKNRQVLWVPPLCRGPGYWWGARKKLLLQGKNGRLTLVDFSHVDLDRNDLF